MRISPAGLHLPGLDLIYPLPMLANVFSTPTPTRMLEGFLRSIQLMHQRPNFQNTLSAGVLLLDKRGLAYNGAIVSLLIEMLGGVPCGS